MGSDGNGVEVSVILPVRNEGRYIETVLGDLGQQTYPRDRLEVIFVDGESDDDTIDRARRFQETFPHFTIISNPRRLSSRARNLGVKEAQGQYVLFVDGHCHIPSPTMIDDMVRMFQKNNVDALCRAQPLTMPPQTLFQRAVAEARASTIGHALNSTIYSELDSQTNAASSAAMYRREVFDKVGLFDESFDACEDVEFNTRVDNAGLRAAASSRLKIEYAARRTVPALFRQLLRYGIGRWRLLRKHPNTLGSGVLAPLGLIHLLMFLPIVWLADWTIGLIASTPLIIYLFVVAIVSVSIARKHSLLMLFLLPVIFLTIHIALGMGLLLGPLKRKP